MVTTQATIRLWLERGLRDEDKPTHMLVVCDDFDYEDYPIYVYPHQNVRDVVKEKTNTNMQRLMEVYNLALPIEDQLNERRAFNY